MSVIASERTARSVAIYPSRVAKRLLLGSSNEPKALLKKEV